MNTSLFKFNNLNKSEIFSFNESYIPRFSEFLNEETVPKEIEHINLDKLNWYFDSDLTDKLTKSKNIEFAKVYKVKDSDRNLEYTLKSWFGDGIYHIVLVENGKIIFANKYIKDDKIYFDQDCKIIIGSKIKF